MQRRSFIGAVTTVLGALSVPSFLLPDETLPPIYGDGVHDDAPGIQARLDRGIPVELEHGEYRLDDTILLSDDRGDLSIKHSRLETNARPWLRVEDYDPDWNNLKINSDTFNDVG